ncbi:UNVERIFIED_CONTAM: hypothetical protein K2H54_007318 [Gekko kuhli]
MLSVELRRWVAEKSSGPSCVTFVVADFALEVRWEYPENIPSEECLGGGDGSREGRWQMGLATTMVFTSRTTAGSTKMCLIACVPFFWCLQGDTQIPSCGRLLGARRRLSAPPEGGTK